MNFFQGHDGPVFGICRAARVLVLTIRKAAAMMIFVYWLVTLDSGSRRRSSTISSMLPDSDVRSKKSTAGVKVAADPPGSSSCRSHAPRFVRNAPPNGLGPRTSS